MKLWKTILIVLVVIIVVAAIVIHCIRARRLRRETVAYMQRIISNNDNIRQGFLTNVPLTLYINLDKNVKRREWMENQLKKSGSRYVRIPGVLYNPSNPLPNSKMITSGERGCYQAHMKAMKYAYEQHVSYVLILEDDVSFHFSKIWPKQIHEIASMKNDWDIIRLHHFNEGQVFNNKHPIDIVKHRIYKTGAMAYLVSRQGLEKLNNHMKGFTHCFNNNRCEVADWHLVNSNKMNVYYLNKVYMPCRVNNDTSIQVGIKKHNLDYSERHNINSIRKYILQKF